MADYSFTLPDPASTEKHGAALAQLLKTGDTVLLYGDLGMGKTSLCRGIIHALTKAEQNVVSPTFTLVQSYETPSSIVYHYDLYRLHQGDQRAIEELGWEESRMHGIVLVEWPERLDSFTPKDALSVYLTACPQGGRSLRYKGNAEWLKRLDKLGPE